MFLSNFFSPLFLREAMEEALQAAAKATGGDLTIQQIKKLHKDIVRVCIY